MTSRRLPDPDSDEIVARTRAWVRETFLYMRPDWPLAEDAPLLGSGVIDSIGVVELLAFLEREFGCTPSEDEITEANLGTLGAIARFVRSKRAEGAVRPDRVA